MYLLYVDESGDPANAQDHFVVGGVAVHESRVRSLNRSLEGVAGRYLTVNLELHAQWIRAGKGPWGAIPRQVKQALLTELPTALGAFAASPGAALFAVARAPGAVPAADPLERTYEELLLRFTQMLIRLNRQTGRDDHGIVISDEAKYELALQPIVQRWRTAGTRFARLGRLAEVPLFIDSKATRLTQAADFVAHGVYRHYQAGDDSLMRPMLNGFDRVTGVRVIIRGAARPPRRESVPVDRDLQAELFEEL